MYDLSKFGAINGNFEAAMAQRSRLGLGTLRCESMKNAPDGNYFTYDQSEGLDTIVNNVRFYFTKFMYY